MTSDEPILLPAAEPCPVCGKRASPKLRPFCSRRCADVDLHRWLSGSYAVPAEEEDGFPDLDAGHEGRG